MVGQGTTGKFNPLDQQLVASRAFERAEVLVQYVRDLVAAGRDLGPVVDLQVVEDLSTGSLTSIAGLLSKAQCFGKQKVDLAG